ncbi:MAG: 6-bladed beta-propeller, partial [Saprospiraceae bacterium]
MNRKEFLSTSIKAVAVMPLFNILNSAPKLGEEILGHGKFKYRAHRAWGNLDPASVPVKNCHEMVMDAKGRLIMITDEVKNNILVYDQSGKLLDTWGHTYPGGHGLTLWNANGEEFLFICDPNLHQVFKTDLKGNQLLMIDHPSTIGEYKQE